MKSLWSDDFEKDEGPQSPAAILKEQAALLGQKTKNLLLAEVTPTMHSDNVFEYSFVIMVPALSRYRFKLFGIKYTIGFYPLTFVNIDDQIRSEVFNDQEVLPLSEQKVDSEADFLAVLEKILKSKRTTQIISTLKREVSK